MAVTYDVFASIAQNRVRHKVAVLLKSLCIDDIHINHKVCGRSVLQLESVIDAVRHRPGRGIIQRDLPFVHDVTWRSSSTKVATASHVKQEDCGVLPGKIRK